MTYSIAMNFADAVVPVIAGSQLVLPQPPNSPESLQLFRNGSLQHNGPDYIGNGNFLIPSPPADPADTWLCFYRY